MGSVLVSIPVLGRPDRALAVYGSAINSVPGHQVRVLFSCSPGDDDEIAACLATGANVVVVPWRPEDGGDWAKKHNRAFLEMAEEWILLGADDLVFHRGWFDACLETFQRTRACVIGTNDMGNARVVAGNHSTHPLVHRDYLDCGTVDADGLILHEGYRHQFVDDEFVQTAMSRDAFAHCRSAYVEHLHPDWGKGERDATYELGQAGFNADRALYEQRQRLWRPQLHRRPRRG